LKLHELSSRRIAIIVAEDVDEIRDLVCFFLETAGYLVLPAANGQAALQVAADFRGPIDLLLTDLDMPGCGGLELARPFLKFIHE
jgi:two-component system cell cycle sensor histidine kinase/response regulator CckA